ncbi:hypothetical protein U8527_13540 [Kordia algicida OT-1]|uniref:Uncharacterized protein n=1 Tax=Kordia algicida OT-1 TaxID=391587 RepID=A9DWN4_9FLAO|nr:hypothetical protein [Kordia algicida]EDP95920.1 hypothetical protein KAOT1_07123 [Kordia algicida OT-1]
MKKRSLKKFRLRKTAISNLQGHPDEAKIKAGLAAATGTGCLRDSKWCEFSEIVSCYSPCGSDNGTIGCSPA